MTAASNSEARKRHQESLNHTDGIPVHDNATDTGDGNLGSVRHELEGRGSE